MCWESDLIMKIGVRKPSLKKSFKAKTTGALKRKVKKALIPGYGKKGMGWITNPKKALYNKVYNKTTVSAKDVIKSSLKNSKNSKRAATLNTQQSLLLNIVIWFFVISIIMLFLPFFIGYWMIKSIKL